MHPSLSNKSRILGVKGGLRSDRHTLRMAWLFLLQRCIRHYGCVPFSLVKMDGQNWCVHVHNLCRLVARLRRLALVALLRDILNDVQTSLLLRFSLRPFVVL